MGDATINGDMPQSSSLAHVTSYPVVADSIAYYKGNPYGAKSIDLTNAVYAKFVKPTFPYLETPASYAKPYVAKADELGDKFLTKFDEKVPIVKSETKDLTNTVTDFATWPLIKASETKDWALGTYSDEYKKCGGDGFVALSKATVTTPLILGSEVLKWLSSFLQAKREEAEKAVKDGSSYLQSKKGEAEKMAKEKGAFLKEKKGEAEKTVQDKTNN